LPQALIVIYLQKHINARIAERVKALHLATNRIVAEDIKEAEQGILSDFDTVYEARRRIYLFKRVIYGGSRKAGDLDDGFR